MPDLPGRDDFEKRLAEALGNKLNGQRQRLLDLLGDPPDVANVPASFWQSIGKENAAILQPILVSVYATSGVGLGNTAAGMYSIKVKAAIDWSMQNKAAADWAHRYTFDLVKGLNTTTQEALQGYIADFHDGNLTMGQLRDLVGNTFGPERAARIASTEVTRAAVQGELNTVNLIELDSDIKMVSTWQTSEDEHVCDQCDPLDGKVVSNQDEQPPLHPNCRCWLSWAPEGWE